MRVKVWPKVWAWMRVSGKEEVEKENGERKQGE